MFEELMPLLAQRVLVLTLSRVSVDEICVNVIPRLLKAGEKDDNTALTTPLSITGTPQELDQELPKQLVEFVGAHLQLSSTLQIAKQEMAAAAKSAKDTAQKATASKATVGSTSSANHGPAPAGPSSAVTEDPNLAAAAPATGSLFEAAPTVEC